MGGIITRQPSTWVLGDRLEWHSGERFWEKLYPTPRTPKSSGHQFLSFKVQEHVLLARAKDHRRFGRSSLTAQEAVFDFHFWLLLRRVQPFFNEDSRDVFVEPQKK